MANPLQRLPYMLLRGRRAGRQSVSHMRYALRTIKNGVTKWRGTKFLLLGKLMLWDVSPSEFRRKRNEIVIGQENQLAFDCLLILFIHFTSFIHFISQ